jgi:hypothetical protein
MAFVAPWQKPADVIEAMTRGASVGAQMAQLRQQAQDSLRRHQENMARISAQSASSSAARAGQAAANSARERLAKEQLKAKERMASQELSLAREKLREDARQADLSAQLASNKSQMSSPYSFSNLGGGVVLKGNTRTGEYEKLDFPELRKKSDARQRLEEMQGGGAATTGPLEGTSQPDFGQGSADWAGISALTNPQQPPQQAGTRPPRNTFFLGDVADAPQEVNPQGTYYSGSKSVGPKTDRFIWRNGKLVKVSQ